MLIQYNLTLHAYNYTEKYFSILKDQNKYFEYTYTLRKDLKFY